MPRSGLTPPTARDTHTTRLDRVAATAGIWAAGLALGAAADAAWADPERHHPVAWFGTWAAQLEKTMWQPTKARGALTWAALVIPPTLAAWTLDRALVTKPLARITLLATCTYFACGAATLRRVSQRIGNHLLTDDSCGDSLDQARQLLPWLVGRDPSQLDAAGISRAVIESLAENTSDAYTAPIVWGAVAGPAGVVAYRAVNTLDAMFGHRNERYLHFGWFSAKADDVANLIPARLTALLTALGAWSVNGKPDTALNAWRQHAHQHPSPNAGPIEAATAGALGITLGGTNTYGNVTENRGTLGWGQPAQPQDINRATTLATWVNVTTTVLACASLTLTSLAARRMATKRMATKRMATKRPGGPQTKGTRTR